MEFNRENQVFSYLNKLTIERQEINVIYCDCPCSAVKRISDV